MERLHIHSFVVFYAKQNSHRILIVKESHSRLRNAISQQPLRLWLQILRPLERDFEELILRWTQSWLAEEDTDCLSVIIPIILLAD